MKVLITVVLFSIVAIQAYGTPVDKFDELKNAFDAFMEEQKNEGNDSTIQAIAEKNDFANSESRALPIRLVGGRNRMQGRVEVFFGGRWGTVCDDHFDINAAHVICRECGFPRANSVRPRAAFGRGSGPILLDDVQCRGDESILPLCGHRKLGSHNCGHWEDVGVICD